MKIRVLLYKAKWGDGHIIDNLISIWTRSKYSHIEILTPYIDFTRKLQWLSGQSWTSTLRDNDNGTVKRLAGSVLYHPERWDYIELEIGQVNFACMMDYMQDEVTNNKGYAKWDILKFLSPIHFPDNKRNICSEFVNNALARARLWDSCGIVSPKKVYQKLKALGYIARSLSNQN